MIPQATCEKLKECRLTVIADDFRRMVERHEQGPDFAKPVIPAWIARVIASGVMVSESNVHQVLRCPAMLMTWARRLEVGPPYYTYLPPKKKPRHYYLLDEVIEWLCAWKIEFAPGLGTPIGYKNMYYNKAYGVRFSGDHNRIFKRGDLPATINPPD